MACLAKVPESRPQSMAAIRDWIQSEGKAKGAIPKVSTKTIKMRTPMAVADQPEGDVQQGGSRKWRIIALGALIIIMSFVIGILLSRGGKKDEPEPNSDSNGSAVVLPASLTEGLVAYYPFNGNAKDESGNENDGKVYEAVLTADRHGNKGSAYSYPDNANITVSDHASLRPGKITLSAWVHPTTNSGGAVLWKQTYPGNLREQYHFSLNAKIVRHGAGAGPVFGPSTIDFAIKRNSGGRTGDSWWRPITTTNVPINVWSHVVGTWDGIEQKVYLNGNLVGSATDTPDGDMDDVAGGNITVTGTTSDDIRIYNRALSEAEVEALYDFEKSS
jgi:hypothetical protein